MYWEAYHDLLHGESLTAIWSGLRIILLMTYPWKMAALGKCCVEHRR